MFFCIKLTDIVSLSPKVMFGNIHKHIYKQLDTLYSKKIFGKINAYVIKILLVNNKSITNGFINNINGFINYNVEYIALIYQPVRNEKIEIIVDRSNNLSIWGHIKNLEEVSNTDIIECMVPKEYLHGYKNVEKNDINMWIKGDNIIRESSNIMVNILNFQFDSNKLIIIAETI